MKSESPSSRKSSAHVGASPMGTAPQSMGGASEACPPFDPCGRARARGASLPKDAKLRSRREFVRVQNGAAARVRSRHFLVLASASEGSGGALSRAGFVASKKIGGAVERNRCKRLLREAFRKCRATLPQGLDLVLIAHPDLVHAHGPEIERELLRACGELARRWGARSRR
jgi:ribonuclease P protein component